MCYTEEGEGEGAAICKKENVRLFCFNAAACIALQHPAAELLPALKGETSTQDKAAMNKARDILGLVAVHKSKH